jgi:hypothetical protein
MLCAPALGPATAESLRVTRAIAANPLINVEQKNHKIPTIAWPGYRICSPGKRGDTPAVS